MYIKLSVINLFVVMLVACNVQNTTPISTEIENKRQSIETNATNNKSSAEPISCYMLSPSYSVYNNLLLPKSKQNKIKTYFYDDIDKTQIQDKRFSEDDLTISGAVDYLDGSYVYYDIKKEYGYHNSKEVFELRTNYAMSQSFDSFSKDNIYKMLDIVGVSNPSDFFQQLLDSPRLKVHANCDCSVKQKKAKYAMVELTACKKDNVTIVALYKP